MLLTVNDDILHEALIRVPLGAHGALCLTCRKFCEIVRSERYGKMRRDLGWIDYGVFVFGGINENHGDPKNGWSRMEDPEENFYCLTHKFDEPCDTAFALVRFSNQKSFSPTPSTFISMLRHPKRGSWLSAVIPKTAARSRICLPSMF